MRHALKNHASTPTEAVALLTVDVTRQKNGRLSLHYAVSGEIGAILIPPERTPARTDNLWKHTCFEVFIASGTAQAYREFNFSPSTEWAAYQFTSYRKSAGDLELVEAPKITGAAKAELLELRAEIETGLNDAERWRVAVSAVIEEINGTKSFWALTHPQPKPDFHHPDSFTLHLAGLDP